MNISERRQIPQQIYPFIKQLRYPSTNIKLLGSSGYESQQNYSDYDLFTSVKSTSSCKKVYDNIIKIINDCKAVNDMYFISFKLETKQKKKLRSLDSYNKFCEYYKDIDFIKLDYIVRVDYRFIELSIIYSFSPLSNKEKFIKSIYEDIKELLKEHQYYKVLKRFFSILVKQPKSISRDNKLILLTKFFNSDIGKLYAKTNSLKAIQSLLEVYKDPITLKKVKINLNDLRMSLNDIKKNEKIYNKYAMDVLLHIK